MRQNGTPGISFCSKLKGMGRSQEGICNALSGMQDPFGRIQTLHEAHQRVLSEYGDLKSDKCDHFSPSLTYLSPPIHEKMQLQYLIQV